MIIRTKNEIIDYIIHFAEATVIEVISKSTKLNREKIALDLFPDGENLDVVEAKKIAMWLGVNLYDLLTCNKNRIEDYLKTYSFFELYKQYEFQKHRKNDIPNSTILVSFPDINKLILAYCKLCKDYKTLFLKALNDTIEPREIELFNFLATVLGAYDIIEVSHEFVNISLFNNYKKIYTEEIRDYCFNQIVEFRSIRFLELWKCVEIFSDPSSLKVLDDLTPHWRNSAKNGIFDIIKNKKNICILNFDSEEISILDKNIIAICINEFLNIILNEPANHFNTEDRIIYIFGNEFLDRKDAREKCSSLLRFEETFFVFDYISRECDVSTDIAIEFLVNKSEFGASTLLDEESDPEAYKKAMLNHVTNAMKLTYSEAEKINQKTEEFYEFYGKYHF